MEVINIHNAKTHLSRLIQQAASGEEIIICKAGKPIAQLIQYNAIKQKSQPGYWKGKIAIAEDFDRLPDSFINSIKKDI